MTLSLAYALHDHIFEDWKFLEKGWNECGTNFKLIIRLRKSI